MIAEDEIASGRVMRLQTSMVPIRHLSLALMTGSLLTLAFPGWEIWIFGWVALAPLMLAAGRERGPWRAFGLGLVAGTLFFYASCWWLTYSPIHWADISPLVAYTLLLVPTISSGLFVGLFALILNVTVRRLGAHAMLGAPFIWVATEWLRMVVTGTGWNQLGYSQAFQPAFVQTASIGGVQAVSFLMAASSAALAYTALAPSRRAAWRALTGTLALFVGNLIFGLVVLWNTSAVAEGLPAIALQPNLPIDLISTRRDEAVATTLERLERLGREELGRPGVPQPGRPALVIWPEIPVAFVYEDDPALQRRLAALAAERGDYLLLNGIGLVGEEGTANTAFLIGPDGTVAARYDKIQLLPFGEYVPFRSIIPFVDQVPALLHDFTPGDELQLIEVDGVRLAVSICYESAYPALSREARQMGASGFINLTNDAWFGRTPMSRQHMAHSVLRSVENRTEQLRVTNAGYSARIDAAGRIVDSTELFMETSRRWVLPREPVAGPTLFTALGNWPAAASILVTIALLAGWIVARRRAVIELD